MQRQKTSDISLDIYRGLWYTIGMDTNETIDAAVEAIEDMESLVEATEDRRIFAEMEK